MATPPDAAAPDDEPNSRDRLDAHYVAAYEELRRLASRVGYREQSQTMNPTALVHEAWLKLARSPEFESASPLHFKRIAARAMRQVLVEAARRRRALKRPSGLDAVVIDIDQQIAQPQTADRLLALDEALQQLAKVSQRQAQVVEVRFFAGLSARETAEAIGVSEVTVLRDWRVARAWLNAELNRP
jgi:RNA polymerase sigma factor (TIGR02999 family)